MELLTTTDLGTAHCVPDCITGVYSIKYIQLKLKTMNFQGLINK